MFDRIIRGARIADGTGNPLYHADVGVKDGRIARIGHHLPAGGAEVIDGTGRVLAPGFIDAHSHQDLCLESNPECRNCVAQGITTFVGGMCGDSPAPHSRKQIEKRIAAGRDPEEARARRSWADYMEFLKRRSYGANAVLLVGHGALRKEADCFVDRSLTAGELGHMQARLDECMRAGAHGLSFGLIYPPGCYADTAELIAMARVVADHGGVVTVHMRSESAGLIEAVTEMMEVARATGVRMVISHHKAIGGPMNWNKTAATLSIMERAAAEGLDVFCDQYSYTASSNRLKTCIPERYFVLGLDRLTEMMGDPARRAELKDEVCASDRTIEGFRHIMIADSPSHPAYNGRMMDELAAELGVEPYELFCDVLRDDRMLTRAIYHNACEEDVERVMGWRRAMVGTDGSCVSRHPRSYGTFPRVLGRYVRERKVISLEEAVRKMTGLPAAVYNLPTKGLIREGMDADLVLFDPETVCDRATWAEPFLLNEGIDLVTVGGKVALRNNEPNGVCAGRIITHPDDAE